MSEWSEAYIKRLRDALAGNPQEVHWDEVSLGFGTVLKKGHATENTQRYLDSLLEHNAVLKQKKLEHDKMT